MLITLLPMKRFCKVLATWIVVYHVKIVTYTSISYKRFRSRKEVINLKAQIAPILVSVSQRYNSRSMLGTKRVVLLSIK